MALKIKEIEKMIRGNSNISEQEKEEAISDIKFSELKHIKHCIFVNSFSHIDDRLLKEKCLDIITHYRLFKNDETQYKVHELFDDEKKQFKECMCVCIQNECTKIINERDCIPKNLLKIIYSEKTMAKTLKDKLNNMLSLMNKYIITNNDLKSDMSKLFESSYINIIEVQNLAKEVDNLKNHSYELQNNIINKHSSPEELFKSLQNYYNYKENKYTVNLKNLKHLQSLQDKYNQVDGPQYRALVQKFIQTQEIIKIKTEMLNDC